MNERKIRTNKTIRIKWNLKSKLLAKIINFIRWTWKIKTKFFTINRIKSNIKIKWFNLNGKILFSKLSKFGIKIKSTWIRKSWLKIKIR